MFYVMYYICLKILEFEFSLLVWWLKKLIDVSRYICIKGVIKLFYY